jgi:hypothetical protein
VEPPEYRAGVVVLFDGAAWSLSALNAADGQVPSSLAAVAELTGPRLAEEFRTSWLRALDGAAPAPTVDEWIRALPGYEAADGEGLGAAWARFFTGGGAVFRVAARPAAGLHAVRFAWLWPATGNPPLIPNDKTGDTLTVDTTTGWRQAIDDADAWARSPAWAEAAAWLHERSTVDPRAAAWWVADEDGTPRAPVMTDDEAMAGVRVWWSGDWFPKGSAVVDRFNLPTPDGRDFWYGLLRWDPAHSSRTDGLADVLGLRRAGRGVDVVWWPVGPDGRITGALRAGGGPHDIDRVEAIVRAAHLQERRPPDVPWMEVEPA